MAEGMNEEFENELGEGLNNSVEPSSLTKGMIKEFYYERQTVVAMNDALTVMFY